MKEALSQQQKQHEQDQDTEKKYESRILGLQKEKAAG